MLSELVSLVPDDPERLKTALVASLRKIISFSGGLFCPVSSYDGDIPPVRLSERQRARAAESLGRDLGFWDRIGHQVIIPIRGDNGVLGSLVLTGVDRTIGPEEAERWLPVLKALAEDRLRLIRLQTVAASPENFPAYGMFCLKSLNRHAEHLPASLIHLAWKTNRGNGRRLRKICRPCDLITFCSQIWPRAVAQWLGGSSEDTWILLRHTDDAELSRGMKQIVSAARKAGLCLASACGHAFVRIAEPNRVLEQIARTELARAEFGAGVLTSRDLGNLEKRTAIEGLEEYLKQVRSILSAKGRWMVAFGGPFPAGLERKLLAHETMVRTGTESAFLLREITRREKTPDPSFWAEDIRQRCLSIRNNPVTLGAAASWQPSVGRSRTALAALKAFLHARLLGSGETAVLDAVTWNVSGDEFLSWGDVAGACREFRAGLKISPDDANLLNSLGVCLAELGRTKEALRVLRRAADSSPDDFMAFYNLGGVYLRRRDFDKARETLAIAHRLNRDDPPTAIRLAETHLEAREPEAAIKLLAPLADKKRNATAPALFRILGKAHLMLMHWEEAKKFLHDAITLNPADSAAMLILARGYIESDGDRETALRLIRQAQGLGRAGREAQKLLLLLESGAEDQAKNLTKENHAW